MKEIMEKIEQLRMALQYDNERGAHWLNNEASDELARKWPETVKAMGELFEAADKAEGE